MQHTGIQYPVLGQLTQQQLRETIHKAIVDEATAADFYSRLLPHAPNALARDFIAHARDDELFHLRHFENLYAYFFNTRPSFSVAPVRFESYHEALLRALKDELEAVEFYRDVQLSTRNPIVRDTFYLAMVDELEHATQFSTLYNRP
jgi:rubrerythrin